MTETANAVANLRANSAKPSPHGKPRGDSLLSAQIDWTACLDALAGSAKKVEARATSAPDDPSLEPDPQDAAPSNTPVLGPEGSGVAVLAAALAGRLSASTPAKAAAPALPATADGRSGAAPSLSVTLPDRDPDDDDRIGRLLQALDGGAEPTAKPETADKRSRLNGEPGPGLQGMPVPLTQVSADPDRADSQPTQVSVGPGPTEGTILRQETHFQPIPDLSAVGRQVAEGLDRLVSTTPIHDPARLRPPGAPSSMLQIELQPRELGTVTVSLKLTRDGLSVRIEAQTTEAAKAIESDLSALKARLEAAGYRTDQMQVQIASTDRSPAMPDPAPMAGTAPAERGSAVRGDMAASQNQGGDHQDRAGQQGSGQGGFGQNERGRQDAQHHARHRGGDGAEFDGAGLLRS